MPFLDRVNRWAEQRPREPAVLCGRQRLSWAELRAAAAARSAAGSGGGSAGGSAAGSAGILQQGNGADFVVRWAAAVAQERVCAVLDPTWPEELAEPIRRRCAAHLPAAAGPARLRDGDPGSRFLIGLTSGTTAVPKGFGRSRGSWQRSFEASIDHFGLRPEDRVLAPGPLSASLNLYALSECLYAGAAFATLPRFDVAAAHAAVASGGITRLVIVPTMLAMLARRGLSSGVTADGLTAIVCAGQKLETATLEAARRWAPEATIWEYYGAAELGFVAARSHPPGGPAEDGGTSVGTAFPGVELAVLDDEGRPLPPGRTGTIALRSQLVCDGYLWGDDGRALTRLGGWATVRDQGFLRDGQLHVLGRASEMINTGGLNVYPHEVESALAAVPGVAGVVVAGVPDEIRGERVVAGVVPSAGPLSRRQLRSGLEGRLAPAKRPQQYWQLQELPLTGSGKLARSALPAWILEGDPRARLLH